MVQVAKLTICITDSYMWQDSYAAINLYKIQIT